ncbi:hypothetical protein PL9214490114 [Planktothrix tepida PCC 9214]|uniref:Uncharacterized protein n=1 Tax=Planktothrix tepida PCC 9214 TaxID=671072 RepID=A0A1J1LJ81_9CYAN|nr:hypothetical protein PL9214490114 [Planktothrix tepida PCC 9214]
MEIHPIFIDGYEKIIEEMTVHPSFVTKRNLEKVTSFQATENQGFPLK